jgi:hypothetical protein
MNTALEFSTLNLDGATDSADLAPAAASELSLDDLEQAQGGIAWFFAGVAVGYVIGKLL